MLLLVFLVAMLLSVALVPLLTERAQRLGFIDAPDARKVHVAPIPRIGGVAMVIGVVVPLIVWLDFTPQSLAYLGGVLIIAIFGIWDDRTDLDYRIKFAGQFAAALLVVLMGDVVIQRIPFGPVDGLPYIIAIPLTIVFIVGITNAANLVDGLDGLASGVVLLSVGVVAWLAFLAEGHALQLISLAICGAICGFLRYNTHPAAVFMGDTGSQFLGFSLGVMVVMLTQDVNSAVSPMLLVLILGLPVLDTLSVMIQRLREGRSPFSPDRNHLHHKLLGGGLHHYEVVAAIYILQGIFVGSALFLRYESDLLLAGVYLAACAAVVVFIRIVRHIRQNAMQPSTNYPFERFLRDLRQHTVFLEGPLMFLTLAIPVFLLAGAYGAVFIPRDFGILAAVASVLLAIRLALGYRVWFLYLRLLIFVTIAFVVYLSEMVPSPVLGDLQDTLEYVFFGLLAVAVVLVARYRLGDAFKVTPMDFLIILAMVSIGVIPEEFRETYHLVPVIVKLVLLFYGAELILKTMTSRLTLLPISSLAALGILAARGLT